MLPFPPFAAEKTTLPIEIEKDRSVSNARLTSVSSENAADLAEKARPRKTLGRIGAAVDRVYDVAIVGAGLVGLSTAYQLLRQRPGLRLVVVEKEANVAAHQSSHNTGILHAGLYYRPGSFKARLCREGKAELERFADEHGIPWRRCGKLVVALTEDELPRLRTLAERARANGVEGIEEIGPERIREIEPHVAGLRALYSPGTGVIEFRRVGGALANEIRSQGAQILTSCAVVGIADRGSELVLRTSRGEVLARRLVACAGLYSDRIAAMTGHDREHRIVPFRGDYYMFRAEARRLVRALVNPVPDPRLPFLGVHFTRRLDGEVLAGPNAVLAFAREGYRASDVSLRDLAETLSFPGFYRLLRNYIGTGARELWRDLVKSAFVRQVRRYLPELKVEDLRPGPSGVRAMCLDRKGRLLDDFSFAEGEKVLHVRNAPSPAATACLAIGRYLTQRAIERFGL
jgi:L-2-hydroxyglutarate oxidase LhgO